MASGVFGGFKGLTNFDVFANRLNAVCAALEEEAGVVAVIDARRLQAAYLHWIGHYRLMIETWRSRREIPLMIASLIQAIHRAEIVKFELKAGTVVHRYGYVVTRYPDEIVALAFGATVYSSAIRRMTGEDPSCPLTPAQLEDAARQLRLDPRKANSFRQLLKLKPAEPTA